MATLKSVAGEIGLEPMQCPYCHKKIVIGGLLEALFTRVLVRLQKGETVVLPSFGRFKLVEMKPRRISTPLFKDVKECSGNVYVSFKQSKKVKSYLNRRRKQAWKQSQKAKEEIKRKEQRSRRTSKPARPRQGSTTSNSLSESTDKSESTE